MKSAGLEPSPQLGAMMTVVGNQPGAKPVFDLDSVSPLRTSRTMRDDATSLSGRMLSTPPQIFLEVAENHCTAARMAR